MPRTKSSRTGKNIVRTGRLVLLRRPVAADRAEFVALRRANKAHLKPWEPRPARGFDRYGDDMFDRLLATSQTDANERMLVIERSSGAIVGVVSLSSIIRGPLQSAYLGYWIGREFSGRGWMTEAVKLALRYAFRTLKLHRIEANIQPHNLPSRRLARRVGFRREGYSPRYLQIAGGWADHERWAMTTEEFGSTR